MMNREKKMELVLESLVEKRKAIENDVLKKVSEKARIDENIKALREKHDGVCRCIEEISTQIKCMPRVDIHKEVSVFQKKDRMSEDMKYRFNNPYNNEKCVVGRAAYEYIMALPDGHEVDRKRVQELSGSKHGTTISKFMAHMANIGRIRKEGASRGIKYFKLGESNIPKVKSPSEIGEKMREARESGL